MKVVSNSPIRLALFLAGASVTALGCQTKDASKPISGLSRPLDLAREPKSGRTLPSALPIPASTLVASGETNPARPILKTVHLLEDLYPLGCDGWQPFSWACRSASHEFCKAKGYTGGYGLIELELSIGIVTCLPGAAADAVVLPTNVSCEQSGGSSLLCDNYARRSCLSLGYRGSAGVVQKAAPTLKSTGSVVSLCLKSQEFKEVVFGSVQELADAAPGAPGCNEASLIASTACQFHSHRFCASRGYGTGFNVNEYDAGTGAGSVTCTPSGTDPGMIRSAEQGRAYERPIKLGENVLGGPAFAAAGRVIPMDVLYNGFPYPVMITRARTIFPGVPADTGANREACFFLNRPAIRQFDENDDGELVCLITDSGVLPTLDPGADGRPGRGIELKPGERLMFQGGVADAQGRTVVVGAILDVVAVKTGESVPLRRVRFPKWDSTYEVLAGVPLSVHAGCIGDSCPVRPIPEGDVGFGTGMPSSNWWFKSFQQSAIRGVSLFAAQGGAGGLQQISACLKVVAEGGVSLSSPVCFQLHEPFLATLFGQVFGLKTLDSAFVPLDIDVPPESLIGMDFQFHSEVTTRMDFAAYVWLDQRYVPLF